MIFSKVVETSNWNYVDKDAYGEFRNGECVVVRWPDGSLEHKTVTVKESGMHISEQGVRGGTYIPVRKAYIEVEHNGEKIMTTLVGLEVSRING